MTHKYQVTVRQYKATWVEEVDAEDSGEAASRVLDKLKLVDEHLAYVDVVELAN